MVVTYSRTTPTLPHTPRTACRKAWLDSAEGKEEACCPRAGGYWKLLKGSDRARPGWPSRTFLDSEKNPVLLPSRALWAPGRTEAEPILGHKELVSLTQRRSWYTKLFPEGTEPFRLHSGAGGGAAWCQRPKYDKTVGSLEPHWYWESVRQTGEGTAGKRECKGERIPSTLTQKCYHLGRG